MLRFSLAALLLSLTACGAAQPPAPPPGAVPVTFPGAPAALPPDPPSDPCAASPNACASPTDTPEVADDEEADDDHAHVAPLTLADDEIIARYKSDPASLGPASVGRPNAGTLLNGVVMPEDPRWIVRSPDTAWGTQETVDALARSIARVNAEHPGGQPPVIGHISARNGGRLRPHRSHQAGRDADVGYYHTAPRREFVRMGFSATFDVERSFALIKALVDEGNVEMIFVDYALQHQFVAYAVQKGEDPAWLDRVFQVRRKSPSPIVRHAHGHHDHLHVRFQSPIARALGQRLAALVLSVPGHAGAHGPKGAAADSQTYVSHRARNGDTLAILAKHYGTSVEAIRAANGLRGIALKQGQTYRIPVPTRVMATTAKPAPRGRR